MGRIERIKSFTRSIFNGSKASEVKTDSGGGALVLSKHSSSPGDDSQPLETDYAVTVELDQEGSRAVVGYIDPINAGVAGAGEKIIYSRDSGGAIVASFHLKSDGSIVCANGSGQFELESGGDVNINGVVIDTSGNITTTGTVKGNVLEGVISVIAALKELVLHTHPVTTAPGTTGPNN